MPVAFIRGCRARFGRALYSLAVIGIVVILGLLGCTTADTKKIPDIECAPPPVFVPGGGIKRECTEREAEIFYGRYETCADIVKRKVYDGRIRVDDEERWLFICMQRGYQWAENL